MPTTSPAHSSAPTATHMHTVIGVGLFLLALALFSSYDALAKYLLQWNTPSAMNLSRYAAIVPMSIVVLVISTGWRSGWRPAWQQVRAHSGNGLLWLRSFCLATVALCFMTALEHLPLAEATAIYFTSPLIMVALSARLLGERVRPVQWFSVALGFAGMLLMVRPGMNLPLIPSLLMMVAAACYALFQLLTRRLAGKVPFAVQFFYMACACLLLTMMPAILSWELVLPPVSEWPLPLFGGVVSGCAQLLLLAAYRRASAATLAPLNYLQLLMAVVISIVFFQRLPDALSMAGMGTIACAGVFLAISRAR